MKYPLNFHQQMNAVDNLSVNPGNNPHLDQLFRIDRREFLKSGLGACLVTASSGGLLASLSACSPAENEEGTAVNESRPLLGFKGVERQTAVDFDRVVVAEGYQARAFFSWGDGVLPDAPQWKPDASDSWQAQLKQAGDNHDGMHYFPFSDQPNAHGLLVINHEYVNPTLHTEGIQWENGRRLQDQVKKEQAAHGLSIIEIRKDAQGLWQRVADSSYNRRISTLTPIRISGPLAGHDAMKTQDDPDATQVLGTLNNCSMGVTPWGTYLTCEENWHNYFCNSDAMDYQTRTAQKRYGVSQGDRSKYYGWETVDPRFNATPDHQQPHLGYVHEPNRFGWVVEVDPFDPGSTPVKRTALGRFCRECAVVSMADDGRMAIYSGDDSKGEYVYKFVPEGRYHAGKAELNRVLLDTGTLYVAQFNADGSGRWLPLRFGENGLTPENGFADQATVLLNARAAADKVGATPMDRPEWVAVHPVSREVYVSLTNNDERGDKQPLDQANPRPHNLHGQILRWNEHDQDPTATEFQWQIFLLAGEKPANDGQLKPTQQEAVQAENLIGNINGDVFSSPDGLAFDGDGRLWIETDFNDDEIQNRVMGCNQLLCADPVSREVRRFLVGPRGCEITGITFTPDYCSMWINVQHPGLHFPASDGHSRPRSTTILVTKLDGKIIGS